MTRLVLAVALSVAGTAGAQVGGGERPVQAPPDAIVLFDGTDISAWAKQDSDEPISWRLVDGAMEVAGGNIVTREHFGDCQLHVEFMVPVMPDATGQARGNSGVYLQGSYEVQVLDSFGLELGLGDCGAIYGVAVPMVNACRPPGTWQTYDILFHAPRFDGANLVQNARMSVLQNGVWIHEYVEIPGPTTAAMHREDLSQPGPLMLQDHGCPVRYRNIWVRPLAAAK